MRLLVLERVTKHYDDAGSHSAALRSVSLSVEAGELIGVWGRRRSGRTTLLRVAAGAESVTEGSVRFDGVDIVQRAVLGLCGGVALCVPEFPKALGRSVMDQVSAPLLGAGADHAHAHRSARAALQRVGAWGVARDDALGLDHTTTTRVLLARALTMEPRLVVIDEPLAGVPLAAERDAVLELLRSIADRKSAAVLMAVDDASELAGCDRALTIDAGELHGRTTGGQTGEVVPLRRSGS